MNCHHIRELGPVSMSTRNMHMFNLTPRDRDLLNAGQQVQVPGVAQQLQTPAIFRTDDLPHPYVGVCSNCHVVLNIRPTAAFMEAALRQAYKPLPIPTGLPRTWDRAETASVSGPIDSATPDREIYRSITGFIAALLFLFSCVYVVMRQLMRWRPEHYRGRFDLKRWLYMHQWLSVAFAAVSVLHWYFSDRGNNLLHVSLLVILWLTGAGLLLRYRVRSRQVRKNVRLVHTQRLLFAGLVVLLIVGHVVSSLE